MLAARPPSPTIARPPHLAASPASGSEGASRAMVGSWMQQIAAWWPPRRWASSSGTAAAAAPPGASGRVEQHGAQVLDGPREAEVASAAGKEHLVVMVHGLFGSRDNWRAISELLAQHLNPDTTVLFVSHCNERHKTFEGIDVCGERLAEEIRAVAARHPGLRRISLLGHSMGGLISRYAAGRLYDPSSGTLAGLTPCHFVAMATPHLGCDGRQNPAQVPLISWVSAVPAVGGAAHWLVSELAAPVSQLFIGRAGRQFFLEDGPEQGPGGLPLLARLAQDRPEEGLLFLSALRAFETRSLYANSSGDHLVGWANSSLRRLSELPTKAGRGTGVIREDPLEAAWLPQQRSAVHATPAAVQLHSAVGRRLSKRDVLQAADVGELVASGSADDSHAGGSSTSNGAGAAPQQRQQQASQGKPAAPALVDLAVTCATANDSIANSNHGSPSSSSTNASRTSSNASSSGSKSTSSSWAGDPREQQVEAILTQLQALPWRRVDVCFGATLLPLLSHQHIQVQRWWVNWAGQAVIKHLALQLQAMEQLRQQRLEQPGPQQQQQQQGHVQRQLAESSM